jgi:hypothetical protein
MHDSELAIMINVTEELELACLLLCEDQCLVHLYVCFSLRNAMKPMQSKNWGSTSVGKHFASWTCHYPCTVNLNGMQLGCARVGN